MKIMLRNSAGEIFSVDVNPEDTLQMLKSKLQVESGIHIDLDRMNFKGRRVSENDTVKRLEQKSSYYRPCQDEIGDQLIAETSKLLKCLVPECGLTQGDHPNKNFFVLPTNKERLHHWLLVCRRADLIENFRNVNNEHFGICEDHFIGDNFVDNTKSTLKSEAIPTIFTSIHNRGELRRSDNAYQDEIFTDPEIIIKEEAISDISDSEIFEDDLQTDSISQLCRLCASKINDVVYIFNDTGQEQQIATKINSCLPVTVKSTDPLPKQLCMSCVAKLNLCHEFAEACIEAEDKLLRLNRKNYFKSHPVNSKDHRYKENEADLYSENNGKMKCSENASTVNIDSLEVNKINGESEHEDQFGCPLCCGGNMFIKRDQSLVNTNYLDSSEIRECVSDPTTLTDGHISPNDCTDNSSIWDSNNIDVGDCDRSLESSEEIKEEDFISNLQTNEENKQLISARNLPCRICGEVFENIELCISHAESHFETDFYPCNVCDLCFTTFASFKGHCGKQHLDAAKSKTRGSKRLMCNRCGKRFNSEKTQSGHVCGSPRPFKCDECGKSFLTEVRLVFHQQIHQGGSAITCEHCGKMFTRENNLYDHVRLVHMGEKAHCCDQCGKTFQLKARLVAHQRVHTGERPFECDVCGGKFYDKATLKGHRLTHLDVKPFQCEKCGRCFARKTLFKQHTIAHLSEERKRPRTYSCRLCGGSMFSSYAKLIEHRKDVHPDAEMNEVDDNAQTSKPFKCEDCGKSFAYRVTLVAHRRNHTGELPFQCEFCSKRFSQKRSLILHRRIHTGEKPFVCLECGKRFVQSAHLYSHTRLHTGEKPYSCEVCGESFRLKDVRDAHQRKHTGERPFKCNVCGKAFRTSHSYYQHMWIHQGKKPYPCSYCGKAFRRSNGLKIHIRIHTGEKPHSCDICGRSFAQKQDMKKHRNLHGVGKL